MSHAGNMSSKVSQLPERPRARPLKWLARTALCHSKSTYLCVHTARLGKYLRIFWPVSQACFFLEGQGLTQGLGDWRQNQNQEAEVSDFPASELSFVAPAISSSCLVSALSLSPLGVFWFSFTGGNSSWAW